MATAYIRCSASPPVFRIISKSDYDERLLTSGVLQAIADEPRDSRRTFRDGDLFVVDTAVHVGPVVAGGRFSNPHYELDEAAIYATAYQARLRLRQLRWKEFGTIMTVLAPGSTKAELTVTEKTPDFQVIGRVVWRGGPQPA